MVDQRDAKPPSQTIKPNHDSRRSGARRSKTSRVETQLLPRVARTLVFEPRDVLG